MSLIALWLSQKSTASIDLKGQISLISLIIHVISLAVSLAAMYSASVVESATEVCR